MELPNIAVEEEVGDKPSSKYITNPSKDILFENLDETSISLKPYLYFCMLYCFNAIFILPYFITQMFVKLVKDLCQKLRECQMLQAIQVLIYYSIDILMAVSVLMMYPLAFIPCAKSDPVNFQYWAISCLIFLQSFLLLQSYMLTINKDKAYASIGEFATDLISEENMNQVGLGRLAKKLVFTEDLNAQKIQRLKAEMKSSIETSLEEENIDPTLFYFTLETDQGLVKIDEMQELTAAKIKTFIDRAKRRLQESNVIATFNPDLASGDASELGKRNQVLKLIRSQGFRGKRHIIDNLLWPHYQYVKLMQHFSNWKLVLIIFFVLVLKCSYPVYAIIKHGTAKNTHEQFIMLTCFAGMYLNMISILIDLVINEDLKGRRYILNVLETLILQKKLEGDDDDDSFWSGDNDDLPFNNKYKLDLSCNLSLESWDNARRLTITFDQEHQDMYETTFSFLAIYLLYTYIILSQDFLGFDLFPTLHSFFKSPIQEWSMFIDFLLISLLFLTRVNQGSLYNETFEVILCIIYERLQETINKIASVYEDKKSLFDFYFSSSILYNIQNETYRNITHRIYCTAAEKTLFQYAQRNSTESITPTKFRAQVSEKSKQRVLQLCATMEKLVSQIEFDSQHFCHLFLGWFKSDITKVFSTFLIMAYIFFHSKIKHYLKEHKSD